MRQILNTNVMYFFEKGLNCTAQLHFCKCLLHFYNKKLDK